MSISNEQLLAFIKKNPIGVGCGLLSLALAAAIYFRADLVQVATDERDKEDILSGRLATNLQYGKDLQEQLQQLNEDVKAIDSRLVHAKDILPNKQYFYSLETATHAHLTEPTQSVNGTQAGAQMKATKANFANIAFTVTFTGTYSQVLDVLSRLENGVHFCRVLNAICRKNTGPAGPNGEDLIVLTLNLELLGLP